MTAHHQRTIDTAVTADRVSVHQLNAQTARGVRKVQLSGLRVIAEEAIAQHYSDGRSFTPHEILALVLPRYQIDPPITAKDVQNALYRIAATSRTVYRTGGKRSGTFAYHAEGGPLGESGGRSARPASELVDSIMDSLTELAARVDRADKVLAKLAQLGIRIEV